MEVNDDHKESVCASSERPRERDPPRRLRAPHVLRADWPIPSSACSMPTPRKWIASTRTPTESSRLSSTIEKASTVLREGLDRL